MIVQIRALTGATLRGTELDDDNRLFLIVGSLIQVVNAFDVIAQVLAPTIGITHFSHTNGRDTRLPAFSSGSQLNSTELVGIFLLLEHSKAGRVVGSKGVTLHGLSTRSGAVVRVEKEQMVSLLTWLMHTHKYLMLFLSYLVYQEYGGIVLRKISLEGTNSAVRM